MTEQSLIKLAKEILTEDGGAAWSGSTWSDIFNIFDVIYISPDGYRTSYYQVSTKDHRWARLNKIHNWKTKMGALPERSYLMLWNYKLNDFEIEKIV